VGSKDGQVLAGFAEDKVTKAMIHHCRMGHVFFDEITPLKDASLPGFSRYLHAPRVLRPLDGRLQ
jgi:hypothetical protein